MRLPAFFTSTGKIQVFSCKGRGPVIKSDYLLLALRPDGSIIFRTKEK